MNMFYLYIAYWVFIFTIMYDRWIVKSSPWKPYHANRNLLYLSWWQIWIFNEGTKVSRGQPGTVFVKTVKFTYVQIQYAQTTTPWIGSKSGVFVSITPLSQLSFTYVILRTSNFNKYKLATSYGQIHHLSPLLPVSKLWFAHVKLRQVQHSQGQKFRTPYIITLFGRG